MDIFLRINNQAGAVKIRLFKDYASPTSYKEYTLLVSVYGDESRYTILPPELKEVFAKVHAARIAPYADTSSLILCGTSYQLVFGTGPFATAYQWAQDIPVGWEPLQEIMGTVLEFAERYKGRFYL